MEFDVTIGSIAAPVWNRDEVKDAVAAKLSEYVGAVYTPDTVKNAKADRAELNKLAKALDDERKRVKAIYSEPYEKFEGEVKALVAEIKAASDAIDAQVKTFEENEKAEKRQKIFEMYETMEWHGVTLEQVFEQTWLNVSTSLSAVKKALKEKATRIADDLSVLSGIGEYQFEAVEAYKRTLNLASAMQVAQERKAEAERKAAQEAQTRETLNTLKEELETTVPQPTEDEDDGLPDFFSEPVEPQLAVVIRAKMTQTEQKMVVSFLERLGVEYELTGGFER